MSLIPCCRPLLRKVQVVGRDFAADVGSFVAGEQTTQTKRIENSLEELDITTTLSKAFEGIMPHKHRIICMI